MQEKKELQEKILAYRILETRLNSLIKQREIVISKIIEIQTSLATMEEIQKKNDVLFPIGARIYSFGKITEKGKMIVGVGANVAVEKNVEETRDFLNKKMEELEKNLNSIQNEISKISKTMEMLEPEIEELAKKVEI
ncbi:MAG: prefoldin subunit alpha [Candidatus Aenigmatarchaeota archaeon]